MWKQRKLKKNHEKFIKVIRINFFLDIELETFFNDNKCVQKSREFQMYKMECLSFTIFGYKFAFFTLMHTTRHCSTFNFLFHWNMHLISSNQLLNASNTILKRCAISKWQEIPLKTAHKTIKTHKFTIVYQANIKSIRMLIANTLNYFLVINRQQLIKQKNSFTIKKKLKRKFLCFNCGWKSN